MTELVTIFWQFLPYYVREHSRASRAPALEGTTRIDLYLPRDCPRKWWLFPFGLIPGMPGLDGHFFIEKNKPATFKYPLWSFMGDWKMLAFMLAGRMGKEVERSNSELN